jgi:hypothetical protein
MFMLLVDDIIIYICIEYQSSCPFVGIGSPTPPQASVSPPLDPGGGGASNTLFTGEGVGDPILTTGQKAWHCVYSVMPLKGT